MSRARPPEGIEIAALKKRAATVVDFMASGVGTPWEDRGTHGTAGAFVKTATAAMFSPGKLAGRIRRAETTNDARSFVFGCSGVWGLSLAGHTAWVLWYRAHHPKPSTILDTVSMPLCAVWCLLAAAAGVFGCYFLFKIYNTIYGRLVAQEKDKGLIPETVFYNINAYALGPSLLALIPVAGPILALLLIGTAFVGVGIGRLKLRVTAAVIDMVLGYLAVLGIAGATWYLGTLILNRVTPLGDAILFQAVDKNGVVVSPGGGS